MCSDYAESLGRNKDENCCQKAFKVNENGGRLILLGEV